jgi:FkbM family methyltransferase
MAEMIEPTDTVWDVGANIGAYTVLLGSNLSTGEVVAVEPHPANATRLRKHIAANSTPATVKEVALGDECGMTELAVLHSEQPGAQQHSYVSEYLDRTHQIATCEVPFMTGDGLVADAVPPPDIMKIDVEGAGVDVLNGLAGELGTSRCRTLFIEPHENSDEILTILDEYDYTTTLREFAGYRKNDEPVIIALSE